MAQPSFVSLTRSSGDGQFATSRTASHTHPGGTLIAAIFRHIGDGAARSVEWVRWNGVDLTKVSTRGDDDDELWTDLWKLPNAAAGTFNLVSQLDTIDFNISMHVLSAISIADADTVEPVDVFASNDGTPGTPLVAIAPTVADTLLLDAVAEWDVTFSGPTAGQTPRLNTTADRWAIGISTKPRSAAGATTMSWESGDSNMWVTNAVALKGTGGGGGGVGFPFRQPSVAIQHMLVR